MTYQAHRRFSRDQHATVSGSLKLCSPLINGFDVVRRSVVNYVLGLVFHYFGNFHMREKMFLRLIFLTWSISFWVSVSTAGHANSGKNTEIYLQTKEWSVVKTFGKKAKFTGCWASPKVDTSFSTFAIGLNAQRKLTFIIAKNQWRLTRTQYPISFQVDDNFPITSQLLTSKDKTGGVAIVEPLNQLWNELRAGDLLKIYGKKAKFNLSLKGSAHALLLVNNCWRLASSHNQKPLLDPFSEGIDQNIQSGSKNTAQQSRRNHAVVISKIIVNNLNDPRFRLFEQVPKDLKKLGEEISWQSIEGVGSARNVIKMFNKDVLKKLLGKTDKNSCSGSYAIKAKNQSLSNGSKSVVLFSGCEEDNTSKLPIYVVYRYLPLKNGEALRISHVSVTPQGSRASDRIFLDEINSLLKK